MSKLKQAALLMHGLNQADQDWLFAQLNQSGQVDDAQCQHLKATLNELKTLGIPHDPALIDAVLAMSSDSATCLRRAPAQAVLRALDGQAAEAVALLLNMQPWPWRQALIAEHAAAFQTRPALLEGPGHPPGQALQAALLDAVAQRVARVSEQEADAASTPPLRPQRRTRTWAGWLPRRRAA